MCLLILLLKDFWIHKLKYHSNLFSVLCLLQGDTIVVHLYVKEVTKQLLDIVLYEDELQVKFATRFDQLFLTLLSSIQKKHSCQE